MFCELRLMIYTQELSTNVGFYTGVPGYTCGEFNEK